MHVTEPTHFYRVSISEHRAQESKSLRNTPDDGSDVFWLPCETGITETWPVKYEVDLIIDKTLDTECMGFYFVKDRHTTNQNNEQQPCPVSERKKVQLKLFSFTRYTILMLFRLDCEGGLA